MHSFKQFSIFTTEFEHDLEHDLSQKKLFSSPKIYTAKGDLSKRWYVYFSYKNPKTGKMKRLSNIYGIANKYNTKEERLHILTIYRKRLLALLKKGFNPFEDNQELYERHLKKKKMSNILSKDTIAKKIETEAKIDKSQKTDLQELNETVRQLKKALEETKENIVVKNLKQDSNNIENVIDNDSIIKNTELSDNHQVSNISISDAFNFALKLKKKEVNQHTINDYRNKIKRFEKWIQKNRVEKKYINEISRKDILDFLNEILLITSSRTRNNYRSDLSSIFQVLKNNEYVNENYLKTIKILKSKPQKHRRYTSKQQQEIFDYLEKKDSLLLLYIKFIYFGFMRPLEVSRLRIGDIDIENSVIRFQSKTKKLKTKIIPKILLKEIPDLSNLDNELFLFTPSKIGGKWNANETNRRDHFTKRFGKIVKNHFKLQEDYSLYSFRHTAITFLYNQYKKNITEYEAKIKIMPITGHTTMSALEKYLRDIDADLPEDYSDVFIKNIKNE